MVCLESKIFVSKPELKLPCTNFTNLQCSLISCRALLSASQMLSNCPPLPPQGKTGKCHWYPSQMNKHKPLPTPASSPAWMGSDCWGDRRAGDGTHPLLTMRCQSLALLHPCKKSTGVPELGPASGADGPVHPTLNYPWEKALGGPGISNFNLFNTTTEAGHEWLKNGKERPAYPFPLLCFTSAPVFQSLLHESQNRTNLYAKRCSAIPSSLSPTLRSA